MSEFRVLSIENEVMLVRAHQINQVAHRQVVAEPTTLVVGDFFVLVLIKYSKLCVV
jgi:hypothetical protein